jgi:peptidoglycan/xylan/chitin deacetylase (PgdA/CDA1 family)
VTALGPAYPFTWPGDARVCVLPSIAFEMWSEGTTPGKNMPGGFISANLKVEGRDLRVEAMIRFGADVGMWRLLEVLEREEVRCSVIVTGRAVEHCPDLMREFQARGHEIVGHSYAQDVSAHDFADPEDERANIRRTAQIIGDVTGELPRGWISPRGTPSEHTLRLLAEEGFAWTGDYPDHELPYVAEVDGRAIAVVPYSGTAVNDYEVSLVNGNPPGDYVAEFRSTLDLLRDEYEQTSGRPGMMRAAVHAHVYGRSRGRWAFRDALRYAKSFSDVWVTTRGDLAAHVLAQHAQLAVPAAKQA